MDIPFSVLSMKCKERLTSLGLNFCEFFIALTTKNHIQIFLSFNRHFKHGGGISANRCVWPLFLLIKVNEAMVLIPGQRCRRFFSMLSMEICRHCATVCGSCWQVVFYFVDHLASCCCGPWALWRFNFVYVEVPSISNCIFETWRSRILDP